MYKQQKTLLERRTECEKIRKSTPTRIPVICEKAMTNKTLPELQKRKLLLQPEMSMAQLSVYLAHELNTPPESALFLFVGTVIASPSSIAGVLYDKCRDKEDGFLYITYNTENTFGRLI